VTEPLFAIEIDASKLLAMLQRARETLPPAALQSLGQSVALALQEARLSRAFEDRSKRLRGSIRRGGSGWAQFIRAGGRDAPWALFVEAGTKAHTITGNPLLKFQIAGKWISKREVHHPGTLPVYFMRDASRAANVALLDMLERAANRAFHSPE
jgi:hypothetical protein